MTPKTIPNKLKITEISFKLPLPRLNIKSSLIDSKLKTECNAAVKNPRANHNIKNDNKTKEINAINRIQFWLPPTKAFAFLR